MRIKQSRLNAIIKEEVRRFTVQNPGVLDEGFLDSVGSGIKSLFGKFKGKPAPAEDSEAPRAKLSRPDQASMELIKLVGTADAAKAFGMEGGQDFGVGSKTGTIYEIITAIEAGKENVGRSTVELYVKNMLGRLPDLMVKYNDKIKKMERAIFSDELNKKFDSKKRDYYFSNYNKLEGIIAKLGELIKSGQPKESLVAPLQQLNAALLGMLQATQNKFRYSFGESKVHGQDLLESKKKLKLERRKLVKKINTMINERYVMRKLGLLQD